MARTFNASEFVAEHKATTKDVTAGKAKVCTFKDCPCGNVPLDLDAFYKDKSMKGGRSPWCKAGERTYNASYRKALTTTKAPKKAAITDTKKRNVFEKTMTPVRNPRGTSSKKAPVTPAKKTTTARKRTVAKKA